MKDSAIEKMVLPLNRTAMAATIAKPKNLILASIFMFIAMTIMVICFLYFKSLPEHSLFLSLLEFLPIFLGCVLTFLWNPKHIAPRLTVAIIFMLLAVGFTFVFLAESFYRSGVPARLQILLSFGVYSFFAFSPLPVSYFVVRFFDLNMPDIILLVLGILGMLAALAGGVSTLMKRRLWWLALVGSIGAILCSPIAGIAATVITVSSRNDFKVKQ